MRDLAANPYSPDERRVTEFIVEISKGILGGGDDPIGFILASYAWIIKERKAGWPRKSKKMKRPSPTAGPGIGDERMDELHAMLEDMCALAEEFVPGAKYNAAYASQKKSDVARIKEVRAYLQERRFLCE